VSIGDISCKRFHAENLSEIEQVWIVENIEDKSHKENCEKSFTLLHQHFNCVITINMPSSKEQKKQVEYIPIMLSDLDSNFIDDIGKNSDIEFNQNTVPFDFNGSHLLWMHYVTKD